MPIEHLPFSASTNGLPIAPPASTDTLIHTATSTAGELDEVYLDLHNGGGLLTTGQLKINGTIEAVFALLPNAPAIRVLSGQRYSGGTTIEVNVSSANVRALGRVVRHTVADYNTIVPSFISESTDGEGVALGTTYTLLHTATAVAGELDEIYLRCCTDQLLNDRTIQLRVGPSGTTSQIRIPAANSFVPVLVGHLLRGGNTISALCVEAADDLYVQGSVNRLVNP